jgi:hypothetical protein
MRKLAAVFSLLIAPAFAQPPILQVKSVFVDELAGESSTQLRDLIITALQKANLFVITENREKADTVLKGSAEDLVFQDSFQSSDSINARVSPGRSSSSKKTEIFSGAGGLSVGQNESTHISERKHEAMAALRLVSKDGDVIWSTTQESLGAKFRSASADVADKVAKQLANDMEKARRPLLTPAPAASK